MLLKRKGLELIPLGNILSHERSRRVVALHTSGWGHALAFEAARTRGCLVVCGNHAQSSCRLTIRHSSNQCSPHKLDRFATRLQLAPRSHHWSGMEAPSVVERPTF